MENTKTEFFVEQLAPDLWRFNEGIGPHPYVDAYLVVGKERAAFIDALQSKQPKSLAEQIRQITDLPVDVLITHGHPDHAGAEVKGLYEAEGFTLYMSIDDFDIAQTMFAPWFTREMFKDVKEGDRFDLGGVVLDTYRLAGHTPGSMIFLDRENKRCFTGDALGVWLQLDHSLPMTVYADELKRIEEVLADIPETKLYIGHMSQAPNGYFTANHITNMREACDMILGGQLVGEEVKVEEGNPMATLMKGARIAQHKTVTNLTYRDSNLR